MKGRKPATAKVIPMRGEDADLEVLDPPPLMSDAGREVWEELAGLLTSKGRLKREFKFAFAGYCEAVANWIASTNEVTFAGLWYETEGRHGKQQKRTRAAAEQEAAANEMRKWGALFGLSPVDERRVVGDGQGDLFAQLKQAIADAPE